MSSPQHISVVIPHLNDLNRLLKCVDCLRHQSLPRDEFEIIVADNGSTVGVEGLRAALGTDVEVVIVEERGAGPARNGGVAHARGEIIAFTDSDCLPDAQWLLSGRAALDARAVVGGRVSVFVADETNPSPTEAFESVFAFNNERYVKKEHFTVTANMFCFKSCFSDVGLFDSERSEDVDWCHRAVSLGYRVIFCNDAVVSHPARETWSELKKKWLRTTTESFYLARGNKVVMKYFLKASLLPLSVLVHLPKIWMSHKLSIKNKIAASVILIKIRNLRFYKSIEILLHHK